MFDGTPTSSPDRSGWLYGPVTDLLAGCGVGYFLTIPILVIASEAGGLPYWPLFVAALLTMFTAGPHYGATILRIFEQREDRLKYAFFFSLVTVVLTIAFLTGLYNLVAGSWILTIYATWSPWHFAGQNYGLALMFLRKRRVDIEARTKRLFYLSFFLSFVLAFLAIHTENSGANYAAGTTEQVDAYSVIRLGIPVAVTRYLAPITAALYLFCLVNVAMRLRVGKLRELAPTASLVLTQALWFTVPALARLMGGVNLERLLPFTVIWVSVAHSIQYLWVTSYYARRADPSRKIAPYLVQTTLAGSVVCVVPWLPFAPGLLGRVPWDAGLAILVFSVINLHHFLLDGAIWKLRDGLVARALLLQPGPGDAPVADEASRAPKRGWIRPVVWTLGAIGFGISLFSLWETEFGLRRAPDIGRAQEAASRLKWVGRDLMSAHANIGSRLDGEGNHEEAIREYRKSLELFPTADVWSALGDVHERADDLPAALEAQRAALEIDPDHVKATFRSGVLMGKLHRPRHEVIAAYERVIYLAPGHAKAAAQLALVYRDDRRLPEARAVLDAASETLSIEAVGASPQRSREIDAIRVQLRQMRDALGD
jgi:hypothetical protein